MSVANLLFCAWIALIFWVLGQIWLAQLVVYPLFARVGEREYTGYHRFYSQRIPWPAIVPGFASFVAPIPLALFGPTVPAWMTVMNIAAGLGSALVTIGLEIPRHSRSEKGKDAAVIDELIRYNWPRTLCITVQALVTFLMFHRVFSMI
jgi:hypothetical protein